MSTKPSGARLRAASAVAAGALLVVAAVLLGGLGTDAFVLAVDDLAQLLAAAAAALTTGVLAHRSTGRLRRSWTALSTACASWALGQGVWSWYELALGRETPFPSVADIGFLGFAVGAAVALVLYPAGGARGERRRRILDGLTVTASLALVSWSTALGAVVDEGADAPLTLLVSLAYPASDLVVLVMVVLLLSRATAHRRSLALIGAGVAGIAVADSAFLYLTATGAYGTDDHAVSLGWCAGFLLLALAPLAASDRAPSEDEEDLSHVGAASVLPYVPVVLAAAVTAAQVVSGRPVDAVELLLGGGILLLVLVRQYATVRDNARLAGELTSREAQLRHLAFHDGLTGLANRGLFRDRVEHALELHRRDLRPLAVVFCDLDDFKLVNDTLGHASGDALLVNVAARLRGALRAGDTLARLGGDEFAVLLENADQPSIVAENLVEALAHPFTVDGRPLQVSASIGLTGVTADGLTPTADVLLAQADTAMYAAKRGGKNAVCSFVSGMELQEVSERELADALDAAIGAGDVHLVYQPIVDLVTGRVEGVEALARWTRDGRPVPPDVFIPLAERTGLIGPLTDLVLELACTQAAAWGRELGPSSLLRVGVNLSPQSVTDRGLPGKVAGVLALHGLTGRSLAIEITESGLLSDPAAARDVCLGLRRQRIHLSLDDFGVGHSSLSHLSQLPLDSIKLDRAFVAGLGGADSQGRFTSALLRLGQDLGLDVIAEGVETREQLELLRALGCPLVQGYLLARPAPAAEITPLLRGSLLPDGLPLL